MSAYVIVEIEVTDPVGYEEYKKHASDTVHQHGGKYIVRGGGRSARRRLETETDRRASIRFDGARQGMA